MRLLGRTAATLLLALAAARLCVWLHTPIPWMLGPLLATAVASVLGAPTHSALVLRNGGQWVIGAALGLYFTPQVSALVASLWWAIGLAVVWALGLGALFALGCSASMRPILRTCHPGPGGPPVTLPAPLAARPR